MFFKKKKELTPEELAIKEEKNREKEARRAQIAHEQQQKRDERNAAIAAVKKQLIAEGVRSPDFINREIAHLTTLLFENEQVKFSISGRWDSGNPREIQSTAALFLTTQRVIFLDVSGIANVEMLQIPLNMVQSVSHQGTLLRSEVSIKHGMKTSILTRVAGAEAGVMANKIKEQMLLFSQRQNQPTIIQQGESRTATEQLKEMKELMEAGLLSEEEFEKKRRQILGLD